MVPVLLWVILRIVHLAVMQTVTQEIKSDYVVYNSTIKVGATSTEMKRSKSDTNLDKLRATPAAAAPKHKGKAKRSTGSRQLNPTGNNSPSMEALKGQTLIDETHDIIDMPYGPRGTFTICHPGSLLQGPSREETANGQIPKSAAAGVLDKGDGAGDAVHEGPAAAVETLGKAPSSWLRYPFRGLGKKRKTTGTSQETVLTETMSEQSESRESIDISTDELRNLDLVEKYHGPVRMDCIDTTDVASDEPPDPDMYTPTSLPRTAIHSGKTTLTVPASSHVAEDHTTHAYEPHVQRQVQRKGSANFSGGPALPAAHAWRTADERGVPDIGESNADVQQQLASSSPPQRPRRPPKRQTGKSMIPRLPKKWLKKIRSLAAKGGKKKTTSMHGAANGVAYSSELKYPSAEDGDADRGYPDEEEEDWDQATTSRTESFIIETSPLDANNLTNSGSTPGNALGVYPLAHEQRNLMKETPLSRAAGSQSDRSKWASRMKKLIRYQSKSLRFESGSPLSRPKQRQQEEEQQQQEEQQPPANASLNNIAERSTGAVDHGNGTSVPA